MRNALVGIVSLGLFGLLWIPIPSEKTINNQGWIEIRYGILGYHVSEKCVWMMGSWELPYPGIIWPEPKETTFPDRLCLTLAATIVVAGLTIVLLRRDIYVLTWPS
jgi:hypothetical protein